MNVNREFTKAFVNNTENRVINHGHVNKIKEQMRTSLEVMPALTINQITNHIIDGQHRLRAFQSLVDDGTLPINATYPVMFVTISEDEEKNAIVNANTNSKNWSLDDYIASYGKSNLAYKKLNEWCINHTLCVEGQKSKFRYGAAMLKGIACSKSLKDGSFTLYNEDLERGELIHAELFEIVRALNLPTKGSFYEYLAVSWFQVREWHTFKEWLKELKIKKSVILKKSYSNKKDWDIIFSSLHRAIDIKNK